jgi:hypothetical protein
MRRASWFKTEAKWSAAVLYALPTLGLLTLLAALALRWLKGAG